MSALVAHTLHDKKSPRGRTISDVDLRQRGNYDTIYDSVELDTMPHTSITAHDAFEDDNNDGFWFHNKEFAEPTFHTWVLICATKRGNSPCKSFSVAFLSILVVLTQILILSLMIREVNGARCQGRSKNSNRCYFLFARLTCCRLTRSTQWCYH